MNEGGGATPALSLIAMQPLTDVRGEVRHTGDHVAEEDAAHGGPAMLFIAPYLSHHIALTSSPADPPPGLLC